MLATLLVVAACGTPASSTEPKRVDRTAVLAAAVLNRVVENNTFGGTDVATDVVIVDRLGVVGNATFPNDPRGQAAPLLMENTRRAIEDALAPKPVTWMSPDEVDTFMTQRFARVDDGDLTFVVTVAEPDINGDRAIVSSQMWCSGTCGVGGVQVVERQADGSWIVTGFKGGWVS